MLSRSYLGLTRPFLCREKGPRSWSNEDRLSTGQPGGTTGSLARQLIVRMETPGLFSILFPLPMRALATIATTAIVQLSL